MGGKKGGKKKSSKKKKSYTKAQQMAKKRIAAGKTISQTKAANKSSMQKKAAERHAKFKQTKVQTFGGKKTSFSKAEQKRITDAGYSVAGYSKAPAQSDTQLQVNKDIQMYGNTVPEGSFSISEEGKKQAEENKAIKAAKESTSLFGNYNTQIGGRFATTLADTFAKPKYMYQGNMAGRLPGLSNYFTPDVGTGLPYTKGGNLRGIPFTGGDKTGSLTRFNVPKDAKISRSVLGVRQYKLNPSQMKNLGMGVTDDVGKFAAKGLGKYGLRAVPFVGAIPSLVDAGVRLKNKDYMGAGLSALSAIPGKVGWASLAGLAAHDINKSMNVGSETQAATTKAGGLNISNKASETEGARNIRSLKQVTDIGDKRDQSKDARTNSLLNTAFNVGSKIPFVGPQLQNLKSDIKPYTDRINVETPKKTKKAISDFVGNLDSMSDTTRRFVNEFATDNPNIPNVAGLETAADVVQTFNPLNKNYAPQLSTSWSKPLQAIANNFVAGGTKNIFQEAALNTGAEGSISPAEGLSIAKQIGTNINTPGTLGNFEATKLKDLADKYGGGSVKPTPGTILRGITGNRRTGGSGPLRSGNTTGQAPISNPEEFIPEEFVIPQIPQSDVPDLQNIQQQAYNQQMSAYGVPNYTAQFQPTQNVRPLRRRQYFNRDYFTQFA